MDRIQIVWRGVLIAVEEDVPGSGRFVSPYVFPLNPGEEMIVIARGERGGVDVSLPYSIRRAK